MNTSDYVSFVLSYPGVPPLSVLTLFFLSMMRLAPVVAIAPFFGSKLPAPVKMGLLLSLTAVILPHVIFTSLHDVPGFNTTFMLLGLKELLIGLIIAIYASFPFYIVGASGALIDFLRGSSSLMVTDPTTQTQVSPLGLLYNYVFIVLFYQIGGPFLFLEGILNSYNLIPANGFIQEAFFTSTQPLWASTMGLLTKFTALSIQLAAPPIVAILMAEMFLGIANRLAPNVQIAFLGMAIKSLLGLALLWAGWFFILQQVGKQAILWLQTLTQLVHSIPRA